MKVEIKTKNLEFTPDLESFVTKKIESLRKFINILKKDEPRKTLAEVFLDAERESMHHNKGDIFLVKIRVILPGKSLMAEARSHDLLKAIVEVKDSLKLEIGKYKFKKIDKNRREAKKTKHDIIK